MLSTLTINKCTCICYVYELNLKSILVHLYYPLGQIIQGFDSESVYTGLRT